MPNDPTDAHALHITFYRHKADTLPRQATVTWSQLCKILSLSLMSTCNTKTCLQRDCPEKDHNTTRDVMCWSPARLKKGMRCAQNVHSVSVLVIDFDDISAEQLANVFSRLREYSYCCHTTHSHDDTNGHYRMAILLSRAVDASQWKAFHVHVTTLLELPLDKSCKDASRLYYLPTHRADVVPRFWCNDGKSFDVDSVLAKISPMRELPTMKDVGTRPVERPLDFDNGTSDQLINIIADNLPPKRRHELALALSGMFWRCGMMCEDATRIIFESYSDGGSEAPEMRAKVCEHTWGLPLEAERTGFTRVQEILGMKTGEKIAFYLEELGFPISDNTLATTTQKMLAAPNIEFCVKDGVQRVKHPILKKLVRVSKSWKRDNRKLPYGILLEAICTRNIDLKIGRNELMKFMRLLGFDMPEEGTWAALSSVLPALAPSISVWFKDEFDNLKASYMEGIGDKVKWFAKVEQQRSKA